MIRPNISTSTAIVPYTPPQSAKGKARGALQDSQPKGKGKGKSKNKGPFTSQVGFRTRKFTNDGKEICKRFNDARGCVVPGCTNAHVCDIQLPSGLTCGSSSHHRLTHTGPRVPI
eukprot:2188166-Karenia_brevis.AAC.1